MSYLDSKASLADLSTSAKGTVIFKSFFDDVRKVRSPSNFVDSWVTIQLKRQKNKKIEYQTMSSRNAIANQPTAEELSREIDKVQEWMADVIRDTAKRSRELTSVREEADIWTELAVQPTVMSHATPLQSNYTYRDAARDMFDAYD